MSMAVAGIQIESLPNFQTRDSYLKIYLTSLEEQKSSIRDDLEKIVRDATRLYPIRNQILHGLWMKGDSEHGGTLWTVRFRGRFGLKSEPYSHEKLWKQASEFADLWNLTTDFRKKHAVNDYLGHSPEEDQLRFQERDEDNRRETQTPDPK
jgi:hypothetical protein